MIKDLIALLKPRILVMQFVSLGMGYVLANPTWQDTKGALLWAMIGTGVISGGAAALNHVLEIKLDAKMKRTQNRPLPAGRLTPKFVLSLAIGLVLTGAAILWLGASPLVSFLGVLTTILYVGVYTPLKTVSWLNTYVGAIPGAIPPLGGWAVATGGLSIESFLLFGILACWQIPHFFSIAWLYQEDYLNAGFKMLPQGEGGAEKLAKHTVGMTYFLILMTILVAGMGLLGVVYLALATVLNFWFLNEAKRFVSNKTNDSARKLLRVSVIYLPLLFGAMLLDRMISL